MIFDAIMRALLGTFTALLGLFPSYELPAGITNLGTNIGNGVQSINGVFPVVTLGTCIGVFIAAYLFKTAWGLVAYVYEKIPFV